MSDMTLTPATPLRLIELRQKIGWICQLVRWLVVAWLAWTLWRIFAQIFAAQDIVAAISKSRGVEVTVQSFILARMVTLVDWGMAAFLGFNIWRLMSGYLAGDIFTATAARRLMFVGLAGLAAQVSDMVARPASFAIMSSDMLHKMPFESFFSPMDLLLLLCGIFIVGLARIFSAAAEINDENQQIV
jgi:hypothetical protein